MLKTIISDTSCLIVLSKINELEILNKLYGEVITTQEIADEFGEVLPDWLKIENVSDKVKQNLLELQLDKGESSAVALALEKQHSILILDDYKARKIALHLGLSLTGTIGIIVKSKKEGIVPSVKSIHEKIKGY